MNELTKYGFHIFLNAANGAKLESALINRRIKEHDPQREKRSDFELELSDNDLLPVPLGVDDCLCLPRVHKAGQVRFPRPPSDLLLGVGSRS